MPDESTALATAGDKFYDILRRHGIEPAEYMGRPAFLPRQVAKALEYSEARYMLDWLTKFHGVAAGTHYGTLTGGELVAVKGVGASDLVGGPTSPKETILFLPGLLVIFMESNKARSGVLGREFRWWMVDDYLPSWRKENGQTPEEMLEMIATGNYPKRPAVRACEPAAPIPEPPKLLAATPSAQIVALVREGTPLSDVFTSEYLTDQLRHAKARERVDGAQEREADRAAKARSDRIMRHAREAAKERRKRPVKTTLW